MLKLIILILSLTAIIAQNVLAQTTVGLLQYSGEQQEGTILFAARANPKTYLIDKCGKAVYLWDAQYKPGQTMYLLADGSLLRSGNLASPLFNKEPGAGGIIERYNLEGSVTWSFQILDSLHCQHHDIYPMSNGHILAIVWEKISLEQAIAAGRDTSLNHSPIWSEKIIEIAPQGNTGIIVWEWRLWDHVIQDHNPSKVNFGKIADHPERINLNYISNPDKNNPVWIKMNSIAYNPILDQIIVSAHQFSELWVIDHSTNTAQAASHKGGKYGKGGDILYRWGNPAAYNRGTIADRRLFEQHSVHWIEKGLKDEGKIMIFNNGVGRKNGNYSSIDIIAPPIDSKGNYLLSKGKKFTPENPVWSYSDSKGGFYSTNGGSAQRLPNGNTLICSGIGGELFEITSQKQIIWKYKSPITASGFAVQGTNIMANDVFRATLYPPDFAGLKNIKLLVGEPIELNPTPSPCDK